jgi:hypothetical protein
MERDRLYIYKSEILKVSEDDANVRLKLKVVPVLFVIPFHLSY